MNSIYQQLMQELLESRIKMDEPLWKYSTFRLGGSADVFYQANTSNELISAIATAKKLKIPFFIFGGGTNILVGDRGFRGLVIRNNTNSIKLIGLRGGKMKRSSKTADIYSAFLEVDSGVAINRLVRYTVDQGFSGLQFFLGQPGSVGGAVYINAHNMRVGMYFGDCIESVKLLDAEGEVKSVPKNYFRFGYDYSIIQKTHEIVIRVILKMARGDKTLLWKEAQESLSYRQKSQPLGIMSAGCIFRNISTSDAVRIATPEYTCSAGYLIEQAGLKGKQVGGAKFSDNHANFIINTGSAKSADVLKLIALAKQKVKEKYQVDLQEEVILVGDF